MDSVAIYMTGCSRADVEGVLSARFSRGTECWLVFRKKSDHSLYVRLYDEYESEVGESERTEIRRRLDGDISCAVIADIRVRYWPAKAEVLVLLQALLGRFRGVAADEYGDELWTLDDVQEDRPIHGRRFLAPTSGR
jgi:hypothetical protein